MDKAVQNIRILYLSLFSLFRGLITGASIGFLCLKIRTYMFHTDEELEPYPSKFPVRRMLSVASVRAQAECLLGRLRHVGRGAGAASKRRGFAVREEEIWARERQAQEVGRRVVRRGMFLLS